MQARFVASPGALVKDRSTGRVQRIGTVTPRFDRRRKRCVFLDDHDRCTIHAVAPFGCAYFDTHMSLGKGHVRSLWLARETARPEYQALRNTLPYTDTYKPSRYK
jgi:Fe-S-cluster containining protein